MDIADATGDAPVSDHEEMVKKLLEEQVST